MILQSKPHILARYNFAMHDAMALRLRRRLFKINYLSYLNKNRATIGCPKLGIYLLPTRFRDRFLRFGQLMVAHSYVRSYKSCTKLREFMDGGTDSKRCSSQPLVPIRDTRLLESS